MLGAAASQLVRALGGEDRISALRVVDVGAGTGKCLKAVAAALQAAGSGPLELHAVEPTGLASGIADAVPGLAADKVHACAASTLPFDSGSVDVASVGQALHWFADDEALAELRRVLRPGSGRLVLAWNSRDALSTLAPDGWPDHSLEAMTHVSAGSHHADGADWLCLPAALEAAIEAFYSPDVPRQQTGRWRRLFQGPEQSSLVHLPAAAAATTGGPGVAMGRGALYPDLLQSHGAFGRFPQQALQRGAGMLQRAADDAAAASSNSSSNSSSNISTGRLAASPLAPGRIQDLVRAASADDQANPSDLLRSTSAAKPLFRITQHLRGWDTVPQTADDILSNFASISVVAAAPPATRDAVADALRACVDRAAPVAVEDGRRLYAMPFIRDVFVAEPLP